MSARKLDFLASEKDELLQIARLNQSSDIEAIALAKGLLQNSVWGERWEVSNPKYTTCIVSIQKYQNDTLKIAYELNEAIDDWFLNEKGDDKSEHHNTVKDLLVKWLEGDSNVYIGQEF
jgi:aminoglycoside/choline kinase family phosphotransferase